MTDALGRQTDYDYDDKGRLIARILPDANGQPSSLWQNPRFALDVDRDGDVDAADQAAVYNELSNGHPGPYYSSFPNFLTTGGPTGTQPALDVDGDGELTLTDESIIAGFLATGSLPQSILDARLGTQYFYDAAGNLTFQMDAMGSVTEYKYDERYRLTFVIEEVPSGPKSKPNLPVDPIVVRPSRPVTENAYDNGNRLLYRMDPLENRTGFTFDALDRLLMLTLPDADGVTGGNDQPVYEFQYDLLGHRTKSIDAEENETEFILDTLYRLRQVEEPLVDNGSGAFQHPLTTYS